MKTIVLLIGCVVVAREAEWKLLRCTEGQEVCYVSRQSLPTDDRWAMSCFYAPAAKNLMTIPPAPPELKWHGR